MQYLFPSHKEKMRSNCFVSGDSGTLHRLSLYYPCLLYQRHLSFFSSFISKCDVSFCCARFFFFFLLSPLFPRIYWWLLWGWFSAFFFILLFIGFGTSLVRSSSANGSLLCPLSLSHCRLSHQSYISTCSNDLNAVKHFYFYKVYHFFFI